MSGSGGEGRRVRILSDLHLGHPATLLREVGQLKPLLEGVEEVVFNGDTFEQSIPGWSVRGNEQFVELQELCRTLGVEARFVVGNHDHWLEGDGWLELCGGRVLVTHGDLMLPEVAPWNREFLARREEVHRILEDFGEGVSTLELVQRRARLVEEATIPGEAPVLDERGLLFFLSALWPPRRPFSMLHSWLTMFAEAERFVERYRPACEVLVFGHFHRAGLRTRGGRLFCNTGTFTKGGRPLVVDVEGERITVREVSRGSGGEFRPAAVRERYRIAGEAIGASPGRAKSPAGSS